MRFFLYFAFYYLFCIILKVLNCHKLHEKEESGKWKIGKLEKPIFLAFHKINIYSLGENLSYCKKDLHDI